MKSIYIGFFLLFSISSLAQNLVPNPSFEDTFACPTYFDQIYNVIGWSSFRSSPDYYNACADSATYASVPNNFAGYKQPYDGKAYCGLLTHTWTPAFYREIIGCKLISSLIMGVKYYVNFKVSRAVSRQYLGQPGATNKIGARFSTTAYSTSKLAPINNFAHVYTDSIIMDTLNWTTIQGSIIADSVYQYFAIGNFFDNFNTDTIQGISYYLIDAICVSTDSLTCSQLIQEGINKNIKANEPKIFPNPFTTQTTLIFTTQLKDASLTIYNVFGQKVKAIEHINSNTILIERGNLSSGIYLYEVEEKGRRIAGGKLAIDPENR